MFICLHLFIDYNLTTNSKISYIHQLASLYLIKVAKFLWEHIGSKWGTAYNMYKVFFSYKYLVTIVLIGPTICFTKIPCKNTSFCFVYYCFFLFHLSIKQEEQKRYRCKGINFIIDSKSQQWLMMGFSISIISILAEVNFTFRCLCIKYQETFFCWIPTPWYQVILTICISHGFLKMKMGDLVYIFSRSYNYVNVKF